jgi:hypothetical protein
MSIKAAESLKGGVHGLGPVGCSHDYNIQHYANANRCEIGISAETMMRTTNLMCNLQVVEIRHQFCDMCGCEDGIYEASLFLVLISL